MNKRIFDSPWPHMVIDDIFDTETMLYIVKNIEDERYWNDRCAKVKPVINQRKDQILGSVIYIDNYGNVVTNITEKLFKEVSKTRAFTINARNVKFSKIHKNYSDAIDFNLDKKDREEDGKKIALFNNLGYLELSIYRSNPQTVGSASTLFGLNYRDAVSIHF